MKLTTFGNDEERNLTVQFPVFVQPYTQQQLILYQIEMIAVPIIDQNKQVHSYTHLQMDRLYIALNSETQISLRQQELRMYKKSDYEFYCQELFVVKHKSKYSCESAIYFNLGSDIINENCNVAYSFNKTYIKARVLNGGNEIILAKWPVDKHIICTVNNDIPVKIPSFLYVLVNKSVFCNCGIEVENNILLESLAVCHNAESKPVMNFTVNTAFVNYLENLTDTLKFPILLNQTTHKQTLLVSLQSFDFNSNLLKAPKTLNDFVL